MQEIDDAMTAHNTPMQNISTEPRGGNDHLIEELRAQATYHTRYGTMIKGSFEARISEPAFQAIRGHVQLIFTSPPFALNNKKKYDNKQGEEYKKWLASYAPLFRELLADDGSLVIELGNAWQPGLPVMSTLALESLLELKRAGDFYLCQQFVVNNPARLPTPAQWVTIRRKRVTDSFTHVWWMAKTPDPKADNRNVLRGYSPAMRRLLQRGRYNDGVRPSEHHIGAQSFLRDNGGSIPNNVLSLLPAQQEAADAHDLNMCFQHWLHGLSSVMDFPNTSSSDPYITYCKQHGIPLHPARMHIGVPSFFIRFLTDQHDIVLDPFAGSNTTGAAAEVLSRYWIAFETVEDYIRGSQGRFQGIR